jgi:hypothetical protein
MPPRVDPAHGGSDEEADNLVRPVARGERGAAGAAAPHAGVGQLIAPNPQKRAELLAARAASERAAAQRNSGGVVGGSGVLGGPAAADVNSARLQRLRNEQREKEARRNAAEQERKQQEQQKIDDHRTAQRLKAVQLQQQQHVSSAAVRDAARAHWAGEGRGAGRAAQGNREAAREGPGAAAATLQNEASLDDVEDQIMLQVMEQSRREQEQSRREDDEIERVIGLSLADRGPGGVGAASGSAANGVARGASRVSPAGIGSGALSDGGKAGEVGATSSQDQDARGGGRSSGRGGVMRGDGAMRDRSAGMKGARAAASPYHNGEEPAAAPASGDSKPLQAARLQALLHAKREHDNALSVIEQCEAAGALTSAEAYAQRAQADADFERAKAEAGLGTEEAGASQNMQVGASRNMQVGASRNMGAPGRVSSERTEAVAEGCSGRARGRQVGAKNTADAAANGAVRGGGCSKLCPCLEVRASERASE